MSSTAEHNSVDIVDGDNFIDGKAEIACYFSTYQVFA